MQAVFFVTDTMLIFGVTAAITIIVLMTLSARSAIRSYRNGKFFKSAVAIGLIAIFPVLALEDWWNGKRVSDAYDQVHVLGESDRALPVVFSSSSSSCLTLCRYLLGANILESVVQTNERLAGSTRMGAIRHFQYTLSAECKGIKEITLKDDFCIQRAELKNLPDSYLLLRIDDTARRNVVPDDVRELGIAGEGSFFIAVDRIENDNVIQVARAFKLVRFRRQWIPFLAFLTLQPPPRQTVGVAVTRDQALAQIMHWPELNVPPHKFRITNDRVRQRLIYYHPVKVFQRFWQERTVGS